MDELPPGWKRVEDATSGKIHYLTRHPEVKIERASQLEVYHKKGRYKEMDVMKLNFGSKKRAKSYSLIESSASEDIVCKKIKKPDIPNKAEIGIAFNEIAEEILMETDNTTSSMRKDVSLSIESRLTFERNKLDKAVSKLTINPELTVDHGVELNKAAMMMNALRLQEYDGQLKEGNLELLKLNIGGSSSFEDVALALQKCPEIMCLISKIEHSKVLEELIRIREDFKSIRNWYVNE